MNLLLYAPALLYIFFTTLGLVSSLIQITLIVLVQIALAAPFLTNPSNALIYLHTAFNFSREFSWEWTVNWRWLGEEAFSSPELSKGLLALNAFVLVLFGFKWAEKEGGVFRVIWRGLKRPTKGAALSIPSADREFPLSYIESRLTSEYRRRDDLVLL
jgi:alpha-1,3-mannosyltransferase